MIYSRRGRPKKGFGEKKDLVTTLRLNSADAMLLSEMANNSGVSVYKFVERLVKDTIEDYRDEREKDYDESYDYPEDIGDDDDEKVQFDYFM